MAGRGKGDPRNKSFRYPPIIPIIYYEGAESWSADLNLRDRILMNDIFSDFIPAGNEPSGHACMHIWRLPQGSIPRSSAALQV